MIALPQNTALIIVDVQKGFDDPKWGRRNNLQAEQNIAKLLEMWRVTGRPIIHVQHCSQEANSPLRAELEGNEIKDIVKPQFTEVVIKKQVNSCFIGTDLEARLRQGGWHTLAIVGLTTPHCVSTTARMAGNLGFQTYVVSDATAAFELIGPDGQRYSAEEIHAVSLATLHREFATVIETDTLLEMAKI
jgi:nicotinamidase-related amidase